MDFLQIKIKNDLAHFNEQFTVSKISTKNNLSFKTIDYLPYFQVYCQHHIHLTIIHQLSKDIINGRRFNVLPTNSKFSSSILFAMFFFHFDTFCEYNIVCIRKNRLYVYNLRSRCLSTCMHSTCVYIVAVSTLKYIFIREKNIDVVLILQVRYTAIHNIASTLPYSDNFRLENSYNLVKINNFLFSRFVS